VPRLLLFFITIPVIFISCNGERGMPTNEVPVKVELPDTTNVKLGEDKETTREETASNLPDTATDCISLWNRLIERQKNLDQLVKNQINKNPQAPEVNKRLLSSLSNINDSTLKILQPLTAVFAGIDSLPFAISNAQWKEVENGHRDFFPEDAIIDKYDTVTYPSSKNTPPSKEEVASWSARFYYPESIQELSDEQRRVFVYSTDKAIESTVASIGKQNSLCGGGYAFYNFEHDTLNENMLMTSREKLELTFGSWPRIDSLLQNHPINECYSCPNSLDLSTTFAKLSGFDNFYFVYAGIGSTTKDLYEPFRKLIFIDDQDQIITVWSDIIDLFGCACL
jgi:hypothetical protein